MFIAIVDFAVQPADRDTALSALRAEESVVRAMPGCQGYRHVLDPSDGGRITVLHEWDDRPSFDAYAASPTFATASAVLRPLMTGPPSSRRFVAELVEVVA